MFSNIEIKDGDVYNEECDLWFTEQNADMLRQIDEVRSDQ